MKVFISYASEYRDIADRIAVGLRQEGFSVFFDRDQLPPGGGYDTRIRKAIKQSDLFIFLISPESISENAYALTEMGFARERWKNPTGHVLPVFIAETNLGAVPAYLRSVTILQPEGDAVAEVLASVSRLKTKHRRKLTIVAVCLIATVTFLSLIFSRYHEWITVQNGKQNCYLLLQVRLLKPLPENEGEYVAYISTSAGETNSFLLSNAGAGPIQIDLGQQEDWGIEIIGPNGTSFQKIKITGCPQSPFKRDLDENHRLIIQPR